MHDAPIIGAPTKGEPMQRPGRLFQRSLSLTKPPHSPETEAADNDLVIQQALTTQGPAAASPRVVQALSRMVGNHATRQMVQRALGITTGAPASVQRDLADDIAGGHAWDKHVIEEDLFPDIDTRAEFAELLRDVMANPEGTKDLARGRKCYIKDNIVLITDPRSRDKGTCFTNHNPSAKMARLT
jgi:hypothetical protein